MKHFTLFLRKGFTSALALALAMIVLGGGSALADTVIVDGSTIADGWGTGQIASTANKVSIPGQSDISSTGSFTNGGTYLAGYKYSWYALYSTQKVSIASGQKFIISAQGMGSTSAQLCLKYSSTSQTANSSFEVVANFTTEIQSSSAQVTFTDLVVEDIPEGEYYFQIISKAVNINSVIIGNPSATPKLSVSPISVDFGSVATSDMQRTITVSNIGVGPMDVTIVNDNEDDFTVSSTSLTGIDTGESQTFDVTFNYDAGDLGLKSATITGTPSLGTAINISVTATAVELLPDYTFDENVTSSWNASWSGTKSVLLKYTPSNGWNTFCVPFEPADLMDDIFGAGWKAYTFSSYSEGTISFTKATNVVARIPYVVYVETAASHPSGILFETSSNIYTNPTDQQNNGVTFQGTYAPKAAGSITGNYGVTSDGRIAKAGSGATLKGYRAYFTGVPASSGIKGFVIDGEDATDIGLVQMVEGSDKPVYNMSGQKVQKAQRGIYIINGKKVVIK